jgi:hypothetical protein
MRLLILYIFILLGWNVHLRATTTKVGNGNDGTDLKHYQEVKEGPIFIAKFKAIELLKERNVSNIKALGALTSSLRNSKMYLAKTTLDQKQLDKIGASHKGHHIYARTFPNPQAATRFFPKSLELDEDELIALHIHEALHRSLPKHLRENEAIVDEITESITAPDTTRDEIEEIVLSLLKDNPAPTLNQIDGKQRQSPRKYSQVEFNRYDQTVVDRSRLNNPSEFNLEYRLLSGGSKKSFGKRSPFESLTYINTHLYPFGEGLEAFGIGVGMSFIDTDDQNYMGPLNLSARMLFFTAQGFDFEGYAEASLNTLSSEEFTNSYIGRDVFTAGISIQKDMGDFYIQNNLSYTAPSTSEEKVGGIDIDYEFGQIYAIQFKAGREYKGFRLGGFADLMLMENTKITQSNFEQDTGRLRYFSVGPELSYRWNKLEARLFGRFKVNSTNDVNFDELGNILGVGVGNGYIGTGVTWKF